MIYTTLNAISTHIPFHDDWEKLLKHLGKTKADDEPLAMTAILESNGIDGANWCLRALGPEYHKIIADLACDYAEMALEYVPACETRPSEYVRVTQMRRIEGKAAAKAASQAAWDAADAAWASKDSPAASLVAWTKIREKQAARFREVMEANQ